jgi:hypothetical protein
LGTEDREESSEICCDIAHRERKKKSRRPKKLCTLGNEKEEKTRE